jgi:hypothetical protein
MYVEANGIYACCWGGIGGLFVDYVRAGMGSRDK